MAFIEWNDNLSVKIEIFDNQHKKLVSLLNDLHDAMSKGKGNDILGDVLKALIDYTDYHFKTEEEIFKKYGYPGTESHINEHNDLIKQAHELYNNHLEGKILISVKTLNFLLNWVTRHIKQTDMKYSDFLSGKL